MKKLDGSKFQLHCKQCNETLDLGKFLKKETSRYGALHGFLRKHLAHELMCEELLLEYKITLVSDPTKVIDTSTPEKHEGWLRATKLLLDAITRVENQKNPSGDEAPAERTE